MEDKKFEHHCSSCKCIKYVADPAKMERLLKRIMVHNLARSFCKADFLPDCGGNYKCMFSEDQVCRDWGGLCPTHKALFNEALGRPESK